MIAITEPIWAVTPQKLDELTPYAAEFRYDETLEETCFDRHPARQLVRDVRAHVEAKIRRRE